MARACVLVLVSIIALAAGTAAIWAAVSLASPAADHSSETGARRDTALAVSRFYAAANERLDGGTTTALQAATTPDFAFHSASLPDAAGLDDYDRLLDDLDRACGDCLLSVDTVVIEPNTASVVVTARTTAPADAYGLPITGPVIVWTGHDLLRLEDGLVSEYHSQAATPAAVRPLITDIFLNNLTGLAVVDIVHLSMARGASLAREGLPITQHVVVELGSLGVEFTDADPEWEGPPGPPRPADDMIGAGEHIAIPAGVGFTLLSAGGSPTGAWAFSLLPFKASPDGNPPSPAVELERAEGTPGIRQRVLGTAVVATAPGGQAALTVVRLRLGEDASVAPHEVVGTEIVSVGAGGLDVTVTGGDSRLVRGADAGSQGRKGTGGQGEEWTATTTLHALDTAVIRGEVAAARNVGPAPVDLVLILIVPTDSNAPAS